MKKTRKNDAILRQAQDRLFLTGHLCPLRQGTDRLVFRAGARNATHLKGSEGVVGVTPLVHVMLTNGLRLEGLNQRG